MKTPTCLGALIAALAIVGCATPQPTPSKAAGAPPPVKVKAPLDTDALGAQWQTLKVRWKDDHRPRALPQDAPQRLAEIGTTAKERAALEDLYRRRMGQPVFFLDGKLTKAGLEARETTSEAWTHGIKHPSGWPDLDPMRAELTNLDEALDALVSTPLSAEDLEGLDEVGAGDALYDHLDALSTASMAHLQRIEALQIARADLIARLDAATVVALWKLARATRPRLRVRRSLDPIRGSMGIPTDLVQHPDTHHHLAAPTHEDYKRLRSAYARYWALHQTRPDWNFWKTLPQGMALGRSHRRIPALRERLRAEGFEVEMPEGDLAARFDESLGEVILAFQDSRGLKRTGKLNGATLKALSVPPGKLLERLHLGLVRWQDSRGRLDDLHVRINIARFQVQFIRGGEVEHRFDAIVGKPWSQTPRFDGHIEHVVVLPWWWGTSEKRQTVPPGPKNPLGILSMRVAPTRKHILLHGTNEPRLFGRPYRAYSHGCVRVKDPVALARLLLDNDAGPETSEDLPGFFEGGKTHPVPLARSVPILFEYNTTWIHESTGLAHFNEDIYRIDRAITQIAHIPPVAIESWPTHGARRAEAGGKPR